MQEAIEIIMELNGLPFESAELQKMPFRGLLQERMDFSTKSMIHSFNHSIKMHMMQFKDIDDLDMNQVIDVDCDFYVEEILSSNCLDKIVSDLYCPTFFQILFK